MSLYGALFSGVSGLTAQSSAMGAISDNITNVSTVGYKGTTVNFQTLVTKQTSSTFYSAGGVQSKPRQSTDVQGLLQASTSSTDISMSGGGFFVVNEANVPGVTDPYLYTRAGSFIQDDQGFLKNSQGYYLQGWPTDAAGTVVPAASNLTVTNQNIISTDYLESINLNRVGGTAASTTNVAIGANLPSSDTAGTTHKTDVQFFNSLGNANNLSIVYTKTATGNQWDATVAPPPGTAVSTLYDTATTPLIHDSMGLVEFTAIPAATSSIKINGNTYTFTTGATAGQNISTAAGQTLSNVVSNLVAAVKATDPTFQVPTSASSSRIAVKSGVSTAIEFHESGVAPITVDLSSTLGSAGAAVTNQTGTFTVQQQNNAYSDFTLFKLPTTLPTDSTDTITINGTTYTYKTAAYAVPLGGDATPTIKQATAQVDTATLSGTVEAGDAYTLAVDGNPAVSYTVLASDTSLADIATGLAAAFNANAASAAVATATVVGNAVVLTATEAQRGRALTTVAGVVDAGTIDAANTNVTTTANVAPSNITTVAQLVAAMEVSIEGNDAVLATTGGRVRSLAVGGATVDTLYIETVAGDTNDVVTSGIAAAAARPTDGNGTAYTSTTIPVATAASIIFNADGLPSAFNIGAVEILNFTDGANNMSNATGEGSRITLDFGTVLEANGLTQFGAEFTPAFITQNGSKFGTFAGVTIGQDGLVTALFDNGETRKIFKIPIATFVNPNQLDSKSGNVWSASQNSGDYTLRVADSGPAGQVVQGALEASTVDIGAEFTNMIVVQRAYSASTKIISTADQMLEELMRVKR